MTRTNLPDLLRSTVTDAHHVISSNGQSAPFKEAPPPRGPCDPAPPPQEDQPPTRKKNRRPENMEGSPYRRQADAPWNPPGRQARQRFSAPDIFSQRLMTQPLADHLVADMSEPKRRTRSKSAPRVQTNLLSMAFPEGSSPAQGRRSRDAQRTTTTAPPSGAPWRPDVSPRRQSSYQATRALLHDVHPSKLQPPADAAACAGSRYSPCYGQEEEGVGPDKGGATSPHVRCRVDIKPDAMAAAVAKHQRQHGSGHGGSARSLTVPRHFSYSSRATPTATPTDSLGREYRRAATGGRYSSRSMPNTSYLQQQVAAEVSGGRRMASPGDYYDYAAERPTTPADYFYTEESPRYMSHAPPPNRPSSYFPEDCFMAGQNFTPKVCYVQDPRTRAVHAVPGVVGMSSPYFTAELEAPCYHPLYPTTAAAYAKPAGEHPPSYIVQTPPGPTTARTFFGGLDDHPRMYQIQTAPPRLYYHPHPAGGDASAYGRVAPPLAPEHHYPAGRAYYTEGRRHARVVAQPTHSDEWYAGSEAGSGYSTNPPASYVSQATPTRVRQDWSPAPCVVDPPPRMGVDSKSYSRSWDDILSAHAERGAGPHRGGAGPHRGQSYDNLLDPRKPAGGADDTDHKPRQRPVVVNLSSSPRRYAALSMSDNSLIDKSPTASETARSLLSSGGRHWFVTPEITITDNDLRPAVGAGPRSSEPERSASWDVLDSRRDAEQRSGGGMSCFASASPCRDKTQENASSLQQSLEQLDELLADLVTDYKPPSRRASEDILDQLKKLIDEEEAASMSRKAEPLPLDKQPTSIRRMNPEDSASLGGGGGGVAYTDSASIGVGGGVASSSDALKSADECSPDQSPDEDDTMMCSNNRCRRTETVFNACLYFKSCHSCYTYYCSRGCRRSDWDAHKESCLYGRVGSVCRHVIRHCRETSDVHKAFSRLAKVGFLSRGRGVLFLGFPNPSASGVFLQRGLDGLAMSPTYLSLRELDSFKDNLGEYCGELREAGGEYDPNECFLLNVSIAVGEATPPGGAAPRSHTPTVRKYAKVALASFSPERKVHREEEGGEGAGGVLDMETLILTPPPGTADIDREGEEGRKAREVCFINIQRELRLRGVSLRNEYPAVYRRLCDFVERNRRFTPTTVYPTDRRTGKQFMCMIMAASEPRTLDWVGTPHLLDDII